MAKKVTKKTTKKSIKKVTPSTSPRLVPPSIRDRGPYTTSFKAGDRAPEFTLKDQTGRSVSLTDFKGKRVLVYFYPRAMTPGCTVQACGLRDSRNELKREDIIVLGISPDSIEKLKAFEEKHELNFTLLSDEGLKAIKAYGAWGAKKFMGRTFDGVLRQSFLIDKEGKILHVLPNVKTSGHIEAVLELFKRLS